MSKVSGNDLLNSPETENVMEKIELLACPFCGGSPYLYRTVNGTGMVKLGCGLCGIEMKAALVEPTPAADLVPSKDIVAAWNRRYLPGPLVINDGGTAVAMCVKSTSKK